MTCPCYLVKQIFTSPDEVINFGHVRKAYELGAPQECIDYLYDNVDSGKTAKELFPECYKATLNISTTPSGANVYVDGEYKGTT